MGKFGLALVFIGVTVTGSFSQQTKPVRPPAVALTVIAVDANNQPVRDLRPEDFRIRDNGTMLTPTSARFLGDDAIPTQPGLSQFSNRPAGTDSHTTLVLFDLLNSNLSERGLAWSDIAASLQRLAKGERVYLYLLTKEAVLYPVKGVPAVSGVDDAGWTSNVKLLLDRAMHVTSRLRPEELQVDADLRTRKTFAALNALAETYGQQPGRKSLIWISHGAPQRAYSAPRGSMTDYTPQIRDLAANLNDAGISVYPVDQWEGSLPISVKQQDEDKPESKNTMQSIADLTAGVWFPNNRAAAAIEQGAADTRDMYRIEYAPPAGNWDSAFHRLRVTVTRAGVHVRAMDGYYADVAEKTAEGRLAKAALGAYDAPDIGVRAAVGPGQRVPDWMRFQVHVDGKDLALAADGRYTGEFRVTCVEYVSSWGPDMMNTSPVELSLTESQRADLLRTGMDVVFERPIDHAAQKVRVVVQDSTTGATGSVTIPMQ